MIDATLGQPSYRNGNLYIKVYRDISREFDRDVGLLISYLHYKSKGGREIRDTLSNISNAIGLKRRRLEGAIKRAGDECLIQWAGDRFGTTFTILRRGTLADICPNFDANNYSVLYKNLLETKSDNPSICMAMDEYVSYAIRHRDNENIGILDARLFREKTGGTWRDWNKLKEYIVNNGLGMIVECGQGGKEIPMLNTEKVLAWAGAIEAPDLGVNASQAYIPAAPNVHIPFPNVQTRFPNVHTYIPNSNPILNPLNPNMLTCSETGRENNHAELARPMFTTTDTITLTAYAQVEKDDTTMKPSTLQYVQGVLGDTIPGNEPQENKNNSCPPGSAAPPKSFKFTKFTEDDAVDMIVGRGKFNHKDRNERLGRGDVWQDKVKDLLDAFGAGLVSVGMNEGYLPTGQEWNALNAHRAGLTVQDVSDFFRWMREDKESRKFYIEGSFMITLNTIVKALPKMKQKLGGKPKTADQATVYVVWENIDHTGTYERRYTDSTRFDLSSGAINGAYIMRVEREANERETEAYWTLAEPWRGSYRDGGKRTISEYDMVTRLGELSDRATMPAYPGATEE